MLLPHLHAWAIAQLVRRASERPEMDRRLVQMKQEIRLAGPGRVVIGACRQLAVPDPAACKRESRIFYVRVCIREVVAERLGCYALKHKVARIIALGALVRVGILLG
jgi:hypothetical protein